VGFSTWFNVDCDTLCKANFNQRVIVLTALVEDFMMMIYPEYIYEDYPRTIPVKFNWPSNLEVVWTYNNIIQCKFVTLWTTSVEDLLTSRWCYLPEIKTQGLVITDFRKLNISNPLSDPRPTYATNQYRLNNCSGALLKDHSFKVWFKFS